MDLASLLPLHCKDGIRLKASPNLYFLVKLQWSDQSSGLSLSLSLSHTHTHTQSISLSLSLLQFFSSFSNRPLSRLPLCCNHGNQPRRSARALSCLLSDCKRPIYRLKHERLRLAAELLCIDLLLQVFTRERHSLTVWNSLQHNITRSALSKQPVNLWLKMNIRLYSYYAYCMLINL